MPMRNFYIKNFKATNNCIFWFSILCNYFVQDMEQPVISFSSQKEGITKGTKGGKREQVEWKSEMTEWKGRTLIQ